jgi:hypothetical protein
MHVVRGVEPQSPLDALTVLLSLAMKSIGSTLLERAHGVE